MVAGIITEEIAVAVPAERMWVAFAETKSALLPKACPGYIDAVEVEGDGGLGSVVTMKFNPAVGATLKTRKSRVVAFDAAARVVKMEVLEAGSVTAQLKTHVAEVKVEAAGEGACVAKVKVDYERHDGAPLAPEEQAKLSKGYVNLIKKVEAYLVAHPDECA